MSPVVCSHQKTIYLILFIFMIIIFGCKTGKMAILIEPYLTGEFQDDYNYNYTITHDKWMMKPDLEYEILKWNTENKYIITVNKDVATSTNKYSRIDYVILDNMEPYTWCYCISAYDQESWEKAAAVLIADTNDLRKGCNGFPFSRMKKLK